MSAQAHSVSYRALFAQRGFPQLAAGTVLARTGGQLWQIALVLFVLERYHSPALAGLATFLGIFPGLVVSPVAGALLDRHGRIRLILADYSVGALAMVVLAVLSLGHLLTVGMLLLIVSLSSLTAPLSASGTRSLFPLVIPEYLWDRANAVDSGSQAIATVVGPALAGFLVAWLGGEGAFLVTAAVFVMAGVVIFGLAEPETEASESEPLLRASWRALLYVLRHPSLRGVMLTLGSSNVAMGILTVAIPVLVLRQYHWGTAVVGELWSVAGVATVVAGIFAGRLHTEGRERRIVAMGMVGGAVACVLVFPAQPFLLFVAMAVFGLASAPIDIGLFALRQRRTDPRWFGRAFAVSMSLNFAGMPLGSALAGPLIQYSMTLALGLAVLVSLVGCVLPYLVIPREG